MLSLRSKLTRTLMAVAAAGTVAGATVAYDGSASASPAVYFRLVQYPGTGFGGFYTQINAAKKSIHMEMYELSDPTAEKDLAAAAKRHVSVEVLLDKDYSGASVNKAAYSYLHAHGVKVKWAPAGYIFHVKFTVFDGKTADISTANLTSKYYKTTRDAEIIDTNPAQVKAIQATFTKDFKAAPGGKPKSDTVQATGLVWSPNTGSGTAETAMVAEISSAQHSVTFESEELSDAAVYDALAADAGRGVSCKVLMTNSSSWTAAFDTVTSAGCQVHVFPDSSKALYIHEKAILVDYGTGTESLLIGSQNASRASLTENRELSVRMTTAHGGSAVMKAVASTFASDFAKAPAWTAAATTTTAACYPLTSGGNCYEPGEFCSTAEHGETGVAGDGTAIVCELESSRWYWEDA